MAELLTIARPYAEAAFSVARVEQQKNTLAYTHWISSLRGLAEVSSNSDVSELFGNPRVTTQQIIGLFSSVVKDLSEPQLSLLRLMAENGRLNALPEVVRQFELLIHEANKELSVEIQSAFPLSDSQKDSVISILKQKYSRSVTATSAVRPELIGGVRIVIGDEVIDASVSGKLAKMSTALMN